MKWIKFETEVIDGVVTYTGEMPDENEEILLCTPSGAIVLDFIIEMDMDGVYLDSGDSISNYIAWMPLPEPYKEANDV